jgi:ketosteroid isomerase-like protein
MLAVMMTEAEARERAAEWIAAWNAHDLERILSHYTDDFTMSSPYIVGFVGDPSGTLHGKAAVGAYWSKALERVPDLRFELLDVLAGVDSLALYYRSSVTGKTVVEVLALAPDGRYVRGHAHNAV